MNINIPLRKGHKRIGKCYKHSPKILPQKNLFRFSITSQKIVTISQRTRSFPNDKAHLSC